MNKVEKIRAEIERQKESGCASPIVICDTLLAFIDSLSDTEKDFGIKESVIPFGASDSELMEATYFIPQGYHAVIDGDKVIIKKGEEPVSNDLEEAADNYVGHAPEIDEDLSCFTKRNAFIAGAQWQKERDQSTIELAEDHAYLAGQEKAIAKACEWLENYFKGVPGGTVYLQDFKKAIKE